MAPQLKTPKKLRNTRDSLGICLLLFGVMILYSMGAAGSVPALGLALVMTGLGVSIEPYQNWQSRRQETKRHQHHLETIDQQLAGRSRETVLQTAPYDYSRWPDGDNCYVIGDKRTGQILHAVTGTQEAELWILEKTLGETLNS